jgi:uncharacterized membrane protein
MQCPACHNQVSPESAFCNHCGATLKGAPAPGAGTGSPPPPAYAAQPGVATSPGLSENGAAALSYVTIIPAIIFLVIEPYNRIPFVRFHSWQSIGLCVGATVLQVLVSVGEGMMHFIPGAVYLFLTVHFAIWLGLFALWIMIILKASRGEWYKLPVIGDFAEKLARG